MQYKHLPKTKISALNIYSKLDDQISATYPLRLADFHLPESACFCQVDLAIRCSPYLWIDQN